MRVSRVGRGLDECLPLQLALFPYVLESRLQVGDRGGEDG